MFIHERLKPEAAARSNLSMQLAFATEPRLPVRL